MPAEPASARRARDFVRAVLQASSHESVEDTALLCVTELVGNVLQHTGSEGCVVTVTEDDRSVTIEVADDAEQVPEVEEAAPDAEGGRGLRIIESLAEDWGVTTRRGGKAVWLTLALP